MPLLSGPDTLAKYQQWHAQSSLHDSPAELPAHMRKGYDKAQAMVRLRQASEAAVAGDKPVDTDLLAAYMAYIKLEEVRPGSVHALPACWQPMQAA